MGPGLMESRAGCGCGRRDPDVRWLLRGHCLGDTAGIQPNVGRVERGPGAAPAGAGARRCPGGGWTQGWGTEEAARALSLGQGFSPWHRGHFVWIILCSWGAVLRTVPGSTPGFHC